MNKKLKYILGVILILLLFVVLRQMVKKHDQSVCKSFRVEIADADENMCISTDDLKQKVKSGYFELQGVPLNEIDVSEVQRLLESDPYVFRARVYKTLDSEIVAEVEQGVPLVRVFITSGESFVIASNGIVMPVVDACVLNIVCATGRCSVHPDKLMGKNVKDVYHLNVSDFVFLNSVYMIASELSKDDVFSVLISEIHADADNHIKLIPAVGDFVIVFGRPENFKEKLDKMHILFTEVLPYYDMSKYEAVDIRFEKQLIFRKK